MKILILKKRVMQFIGLLCLVLLPYTIKAQANVYITPSTVLLSGQSTFTVDVMIANVSNLHAYSVKIVFNKLLTSIKVDRLKKERSIASIHKNLNSIFISGHGSGTSTIARLYAKSLKELDRLSKGQLIEIDSSTFFGFF